MVKRKLQFVMDQVIRILGEIRIFLAKEVNHGNASLIKKRQWGFKEGRTQKEDWSAQKQGAAASRIRGSSNTTHGSTSGTPRAAAVEIKAREEKLL